MFDNLQIISNNVQPDEMEITIIGDDYVFKRTPVDLTSGHKEHGEYEGVLKIHTTSNIHGDLESTQTETAHSPKGYYHFDKRLNQSALTKWQPFKDMYKFGRRVGNIQYKEGS
jgi:transcriptional regulator of aromatic amino acid metabolism